MAKKTSKWHYVVMRSVFGDLWIGKTRLPVEKDRVFVDLKDATYEAGNLFQDEHPEFDRDEDEEYNGEDLQYQYDKLVYISKDEVEIVRLPIEKFIQGV